MRMPVIVTSNSLLLRAGKIVVTIMKITPMCVLLPVTLCILATLSSLLGRRM